MDTTKWQLTGNRLSEKWHSGKYSRFSNRSAPEGLLDMSSSRTVWVGKSFVFKIGFNSWQNTREYNFLARWGGKEVTVEATGKVLVTFCFPKVLAVGEFASAKPEESVEWIIVERMHGMDDCEDGESFLGYRELSHTVGVYDLTPGNVLLLPDGRKAVVDCGVSD